MSVPMNPAAPAAKPRPGSVTISSYLLYAVAALTAINLIATLAVLGGLRDAYEAAFADTPMADSGPGIAVGFTVGTVVLGLLFGIAFAVLAVFNNRGKNAARIVTWILGGLSACCCGLNLVGSAAGGFNTGRTDGPDPAEIERQLEAHVPGWYTPVSVVTLLLALLLILVALILLALPASNEYFRTSRAGWEPPVPGATYPGYPPVEPGYPPAGPPGGPAGPPSPPTSSSGGPSEPPSPPTNPPGGPSEPPSPPSPPPDPPPRT